MAVSLTSWSIEMGLGGGYRRTLIDESFVVGTWPLSEVRSTRARDITGQNHHGTYVGSGFTRGVTVDLPEGALGCTFAGSEYIEVDHDADSPTAFNLSLAEGSADLVALLKTSTNDATLRCIVQKQVSTSAGNGWHLALQSGAVVFSLYVGGIAIFSFSRGAVADDAWHIVHGCYEPEQSRARIFIDGVQSGAEVGSVTTEPAVTTANLRIGMFNDGAGGFIGTLAYVMVGREGNPGLSAELQATRAWTDVTEDVRAVAPIAGRYGIAGVNPEDNVATTGTLTFALDNSAGNSGGVLGYYSPGHANARSGFDAGTPVRFKAVYGGTTYYKFRGRVRNVRPLPGQYRERYVNVTCTDWIDVAAGVFLSSLAAQVEQQSDDVFGVVLDQAEGRAPAAVSISIGSSTFPFAVDLGQSEEETILTEFARIAASERAFIYPRGDTIQGGTLVFEGRGDRQIETDLAATFSNTMHGLEVGHSLDTLVNIVRVVVYPRRVDASATTVLYSLDVSQQAQAIAPGQTIVLEGGYRNPSEEQARVGGTAMVTPVAGTDYNFWSNSDGTGANLTASLAIVSELGGNSFRVEITNAGSQPGFLASVPAFQLRGKGIYHYAPVTVERRNSDSVRRRGPRTLRIDLPYESSIAVGESVADFILNVVSVERPAPESITLLANHSDALMTQALAREVGDKIGIEEAVTGLTTDDPDSDASLGYFIHEVAFTLEPGGILTTTWKVAPSAPAGVWVLDEVGASELDESTVLGF